MNRRTFPTLLNASDCITELQLSHAPELPILVALDANLRAAIDILDPENPYLAHARVEDRSENEVETQIAECIFLLATALRDNLSAYYAAIRKNCKDDVDQEMINF